MSALMSIDEAQRAVLARARPVGRESVAVERAEGRVLAADAVSAVDLPPFDSSAMDGFALRAADTPGRLPIGGRIAAGGPAARALEQGEAMGIATGGVVPDGADAVVPIERVTVHGDVVEVAQAAVRGANVRPRAGDLAAGDVVVDAGTELGPAQLGALAAAGIAAVEIGRRPRVAVLSTGTELRQPGEALERGQVYEANSVLLAAALRSAGAEVERLASVADDREAHRAALARALEADVVVTSGGVSVGPHDLVRSVGAELGVEEVFWGVAVKPGKPVVFGVRGATLVLGLPGNPVSALVGLELFVLPAVRALQGHADPLPRLEPAHLARSVWRSDRDQLLRARTSVGAGAIVVEPLGGQESHMIARAAAADALVLIPRGDGELGAGTAVSYLRLGRR